MRHVPIDDMKQSISAHELELNDPTWHEFTVHGRSVNDKPPDAPVSVKYVSLNFNQNIHKH